MPRLLAAKPLGGKPLRKVALDSIDSAEFDRLVKNDHEHEFQNQQLQWAFRSVGSGLPNRHWSAWALSFIASRIRP